MTLFGLKILKFQNSKIPDPKTFLFLFLFLIKYFKCNH